MVEIINRRKPDSKTFDTGKTKVDPVTQKIVPIYGTKIEKGLHYRKNGKLHNVDTTVFEQTDYEFTHKVDEARVILRFGDNSGNTKKHLFGIEDDKGNWLNVKLDKTGHNMSGTPGNKPTFPHADGLIVEHIPVYNGVKTNYRLGNSGINEVVVTFKYNQELTPEQRGNTIVFTRDGKDIFILPASYAYDAAVGMEEIEPVTMQLGDIGNFKSATLTVDSDWLENATDPIIDPSVTIPSTNAAFEYATTRTHTTAYDKNYSDAGGEPFINYAASNDINGIVAKVDLSAYAGETIISGSARFGANVNRISGTSINIEWHELYRNWDQGTSWGTPEVGAVCGRYYNYNTNLWTTLGARGNGTDRNGTPDGSGTITGASDADFQMPISDSLAQQFIDGTNNGILIDPDNAVEAQYAFNSMYYYFEHTEDGNAMLFFFNGTPSE